MQTIWKYTLQIEDNQHVELPVESRILGVQNQNGTLCLYVLLTPNTATEFRYIQIVGTGHPVKDNAGKRDYIGTVQMADGALVWHIFEVS